MTYLTIKCVRLLFSQQRKISLIEQRGIGNQNQTLTTKPQIISKQIVGGQIAQHHDRIEQQPEVELQSIDHDHDPISTNGLLPTPQHMHCHVATNSRNIPTIGHIIQESNEGVELQLEESLSHHNHTPRNPNARGTSLFSSTTGGITPGSTTGSTPGETIPKDANDDVVQQNNDSKKSHSQLGVFNHSSSQPKPKAKPKHKNSLYDDEQSKLIHIIVTLLLVFVAVLYLLFGAIFCIFVFAHFDKSRDACVNPSLSALVEHPELYLWDQCKYQTFPFQSFDFWNDNNDELIISCNCRQAKIDLSQFSNSFTIGENNISLVHDNTAGCGDSGANSLCVMVECVLKYGNMLEILHIIDNIPRSEINLTTPDHYSAVNLKIVHLENIQINGMANDVQKWKNLEYVYFSHAHFSNFPETFDDLTKLSFLKLEDAYLEELPNLCVMTELRAINFGQSISFPSDISIRQLPDCLTDLQQLESIIFSYSDISSLPVGLFTMPSIAEIGFFYSIDLDVLSLIDVINKTIDEFGEFTWNDNSQTVYSFGYSIVCNYEYDLSMVLNTTLFDIMVTFIEETDACFYSCGSLETYGCSPFEYQNGVCDEGCNEANCNFDGWDCNQLCREYSPECNSWNLFDNGVCDEICNNTYCSYDKYECIDTEFEVWFPNDTIYCNIDSDINIDINININNISGINVTNLCPVYWVADQWCDENCYTSDSCFNDGNDCTCQSSVGAPTNCEKLTQWFGIVTTFGSCDNNNNQISIYGVISIWDLFDAEGVTVSYFENYDPFDESAFLAVYEHYLMYPNYTIAFEKVDIDNNSCIDINEFLVAFGVKLNLTNERPWQVNCTFAETCYN